MITIYKYQLEVTVTDVQVLRMPENAQILSVANQFGTVCLWASVNTDNIFENRMIEIIGTGNPCTLEGRKFIGTVLMGPLVWHVFEVVS